MSDLSISAKDSFAVVTYTPEPLRDWLVRLRGVLPIETNSEPHITVLPPRPLTITADKAREKIASILGGWPPFEVEITGVRVFPGTNFLYLEISDGSKTLEDLHMALNTGDFLHEELFNFHPHLTVGGPVALEDVQRISEKAADAWHGRVRPCRFRIEEFVFVCISIGESGREWKRLWSHKLEGTRARQQAAGASVTNQTS